MTWARRNAPDSQQAITDAYSSIGEELGALVIRRAWHWSRCQMGFPEPVDLLDE